MARALTIGFKLGSLGTMQQVTGELLDRNSAAVVLLDERHKVVYTNRCAQLVFSETDGLRLTSDGLVALDRHDNEKLQRRIGEAAVAVRTSGTPGGVLRICRPSGKRSYVALVAPMSSKYPALTTLRPAVCVVITDPDAQIVLSAGRIQAAFAMAEAEARLAALLAAGEDLRGAATRLGITYGTARVRLAEIFQKTETVSYTHL